MYINGGFFGGGAFILQYLFFFVGFFFSLLVFVGFVCWGGGLSSSDLLNQIQQNQSCFK